MKEFSILKNTSFLMAGTLIQRFLSFFTAILITRYLGPKDYGQYTFVIAFVTIVAVVWDFGLYTLYVRDVSRDKSIAAKYAGNVISLKTVLFIAIFPAMLLYLKLLGYSPEVTKSLIIFAVGTFIYSIYSVVEAVFSSWKRMDYSALLNVVRSILLLLLVIVIVNITGGVLEIIFCYFASFLITFIISLVILKRSFVLPDFRSVSASNLFRLVTGAVPFFMASMLSIILFKIDHLMISKMSGDIQLGLYGSAYTLLEIIIAFFPMMIMRSSFPVLCDKYHNDQPGMIDLYKKLLKTFLIVGLPISAGCFFLGNEVITVLFGRDYFEAGILLSVLGISIWVFFLTNLMGWTIVAINRQVLVMISIMIAMAINIVLNLFLIPIMGALGSAYATLVCEMMQLLFMTIVIRKVLSVSLEFIYLKIIICTVIMSLFIIVMKQFSIFNDIVKLVVIIPASAFIYLVFCIILKIVRVEEMRQLLRTW